MTTEQKAKAYEQALKKAGQIHRFSSDLAEIKRMEELFPELVESEDERIRKALITFFKRFPYDNIENAGTNVKEAIAWVEKQGGQPKKVSIWKHWKDGIAGNGEGTPVYLIKDGYTYSISSCLCFECDYIELSELDKLMLEKQGKQKPTDNIESSAFKEKLIELFQKFRYIKEGVPTNGDIIDYVDAHIQELIDTIQNPAWSEEDIIHLNKCISYMSRLDSSEMDWLKSLKDRVLPQPKQEWSEEDEHTLEGVIDEIEANKNNAIDYDLATYDRFLSWLKSLRPQNTWKPSDEQMKALHDLNLTGNISYAGQGQVLIELYNDLKKLMDE